MIEQEEHLVDWRHDLDIIISSLDGQHSIG